jgi:hypothetical protein
MPVPDRDTFSGAVAALVVTVSFAVLLPAARGWNVTAKVHDWPAGKDAGQSFVCTNHDEYVPVRLMPLMAKSTVPLLDNVTF